MDILEDSDREILSCKLLAKKLLSWKILAEKWLSCRILAEWMVIFQDSGRMNGHLARFWQNEWSSCKILAESAWILQDNHSKLTGVLSENKETQNKTRSKNRWQSAAFYWYKCCWRHMFLSIPCKIFILLARQKNLMIFFVMQSQLKKTYHYYNINVQIITK